MFLEKLLAFAIMYIRMFLLPNEELSIVTDNSTQKCTTPNNDQGECVLLTECPHLQGLNYMEDDGPTENYDYLQSYECDSESDNRKVCCPSKPIDYTTETCTTPDNGQGKCVLLTECPRLQHQLHYMADDTLKGEYLQKYECDIESDDPKFCCPLDPTDYEFVDTLPDVCGQDNIQRIVGGEKVGLGEFPWMALLNYTTRTTKIFGCGGVLINSRYVLTAAHCVKGNDVPRHWKIGSVRLGEYNTSSEIDCALVPGGTLCSPAPLDVPVEEAIVHEDYNPHDKNQYHDIALLKLAKSVPTTDYVSPICLPKDDLLERSFVADNAYVAGWGATEKSKRGSNVLLKVEIKIKPNTDCEPLYKRKGIIIQDGQLCAGGESGKDSCSGDSGGPLMRSLKHGKTKNFYALGLVSIGPKPCGRPRWSGVYTRITKYMPWIISKLKS